MQNTELDNSQKDFTEKFNLGIATLQNASQSVRALVSISVALLIAW